MDQPNDLRLLLRGLAAGVIDPVLLVDAAGDWDGHPALMDFLVARRMLSADDLRRLADETSVHPGGAAGGAASTSLGAASASGRASAATLTFDPDRADRHPTTEYGPGRNGRSQLARGPGNDRYHVLRPHRTGGLGQVWLARDTVVGRDVALKTLRPDRITGPDVRARFLREARVTGQLEHPGIVPLYDLVGDEDDAFYVMRFVAGRTLAEAAADYHRRRAEGKAGPLDLAALLDAFVAVCRAVAFAHSKGVLHRDLKGQNVVLGAFGEVFLLDWGLGKSAGTGPDTPPPPEADGAFDSTADGVVVGTPAYMAPEVATGGPASPASDLYALGAMLYAVLSGHAPYAGSSVKEVLGRVVSSDPPPVAAANPDAPPALVAVCRKAMARRAAERYASAGELADEVRRFLADEPPGAYREPLLARIGRWARRHRPAVASAAAVLVAATVASGVGAVLVAREEQKTADQRDAAARERDRAEANLRLAWDLAAALGRVAEAGEDGVARVGDRERADLLSRAVEATGPMLDANPDDPAVRERTARILRAAGHLGQYLNDTGPADRAYQKSVAVRRGLADQFPDDPDRKLKLVMVLRDQAGLLRRLGRLDEAAAAADEAVGLAGRVRAADPKGWEPRFQLALAESIRYNVEFDRGRYDDAARTADRVGDLLDDLTRGPQPKAHPYAPMLAANARACGAAARREAGRAAGGAWDPAPAVRLHDEAVDRLRAITADDARRDFVFHLYAALAERGETLRAVPGREADAGRDLDEAISGLDRLAREQPDAPHYQEALAVALTSRGRLRAAGPGLFPLAAAEDDLFRAVVIIEPLARDNPKLPGYRGQLGEAWAALAPLADRQAGLGALGPPWAAAAGVIGDRKSLQTRVHRALSSFRKGQELCPGTPVYARRLAEVEKEWPGLAGWVTEENARGRK